mmetsp:Transcript_86555/g.217979  ORF Transcript_86555/g.217979 Transcript_86555/m.217979 type:complete len:131 (-) Transcript_86555:40-432(-)
MLRAAMGIFGGCCSGGEELVMVQVEVLPVTSASGLELSSLARGSAWEAEAVARKVPLQVGSRATPSLGLPGGSGLMGGDGRSTGPGGSSGSGSSDEEGEIEEVADPDHKSSGAPLADTIVGGSAARHAQI